MLRFILKEGEQFFLRTDFTQPNNGNAKIAYKDKNNKAITKCFMIILNKLLTTDADIDKE